MLVQECSFSGYVGLCDCGVNGKHFSVHEGDFSGSPVVKTLPSNAGTASLIPGQGAKIPHALQSKNQNIKEKLYCNKFNEDNKNKTFKGLESLIKNKIDFILFNIRKSKHKYLYFSSLRQYVCACMSAKSLQAYLTFCKSMDCMQPARLLFMGFSRQDDFNM